MNKYCNICNIICEPPHMTNLGYCKCDRDPKYAHKPCADLLMIEEQDIISCHKCKSFYYLTKQTNETICNFFNKFMLSLLIGLYIIIVFITSMTYDIFWNSHCNKKNICSPTITHLFIDSFSVKVSCIVSVSLIIIFNSFCFMIKLEKFILRIVNKIKRTNLSTCDFVLLTIVLYIIGVVIYSLCLYGIVYDMITIRDINKDNVIILLLDVVMILVSFYMHKESIKIIKQCKEHIE